MSKNTPCEEENNMSTFYGIDIQKFTTEEINEIAAIARIRGHEITSRSDLANLPVDEQENIYAIWTN
jgi:hypothetical protein